jgi:hypothetical protein
MADNTDSNDKSKVAEVDIPIPTPTALPSSAGNESSFSANPSSWKIPYGMEDHIESGTLPYVTLHYIPLHCIDLLHSACLF